MKASVRIGYSLVVLFFLYRAPGVSAQDLFFREVPSRPSVIVPNPEPFTLNAYDATQALFLVRRARLLQQWGPGSERRNIFVRDVRAVWVLDDPDAPTQALRPRYDLEVNGAPLDWQRTYIEYGGSMVNLRLLFTYRNQHPPDLLRFRIPEHEVPR